jgi:hypothetical protein
MMRDKTIHEIDCPGGQSCGCPRLAQLRANIAKLEAERDELKVALDRWRFDFATLAGMNESEEVKALRELAGELMGLATFSARMSLEASAAQGDKDAQDLLARAKALGIGGGR